MTEGLCQETAYYLNSRLPLLALIAKGVPFPVGPWIRIVHGRIAPSVAEDLVGEIFPGLRGRIVPFVALLTDFDVQEFERGPRRQPA